MLYYINSFTNYLGCSYFTIMKKTKTKKQKFDPEIEY